MLSYTSLQAQISGKPFSAVVMNAAKQAELTKIEALPRIGALSYADVGSFSTWCNNASGSVSFSIPGVAGTFIASHMSSTYVSDNEYTYIGKIQGNANTNFAIAKDEEGVAGFIGIGIDYYYTSRLEVLCIAVCHKMLIINFI